jgi:hypothetical protein
MALEYVNRRGDRYYLLQGKTKTGKPKYYASRKSDGTALDQVPDGFEIYEHPVQGLVSVRRVRSSRVLPAEREQLARWTRELAGIQCCRVDIEGDSLVIYTPSTNTAAAVDALSRMFGSDRAAAAGELISRSAPYAAMLRFTLLDEKKRLYSADRWCFLGSIDDWFLLSGPKHLKTLARKYLPHLNRESFFQLM